ncbi:MAG: dolichyl-phosphate beta-glucosyltransferase [Acidobacteriota bacterium]|nr:dolichyl-phosphate beta-glucosyltransferase [Acidobacteriota bacterium]
MAAAPAFRRPPPPSLRAMSPPTPHLTVVVPMYNEARRLAGPLQRLRDFAAASPRPVELLFVDDGSTDGTAERVEEFLRSQEALEESSWRLLRGEANRGKGHAVRRGMLAARGERILFTDVDLSTPLSDLPKLSGALESSVAVAIGSRALAQSEILRSQPLYRSLGGKGVNLFVRALAVPGVHDTQCGFKLFTRSAAQEIFRRARLDGFSFDIEALYLARSLGYRVAEIPVTWSDVPGSKVSPLADGLRLLGDLVRIRWWGLRGRYRA